MELEYSEKQDNMWAWLVDEFLSGRFVKNFFDWITSVIQTADTSLVLLILVILPLIVPAVPAIVTYGNLMTGMGFKHNSALIGGITIELLGYAGALLLFQFATDWMKKKKNAGWMTLVAGLSYLFYLIAVVSINVLLDKEAGKSTTYVWVVALLCLLSVPSGMLSATRIMSRTEKIEAEEDRKQSMSLAEREAQLNFERQKIVDEREHAHKMEMARLESQERLRKAELRLEAKRGASNRASNPLQNSQVFEATTSKSASSHSSEANPVSKSEAVIVFIEDFLKQNNALPKTKPLMEKFGVSQSGAYYMMVKYIVANGEPLVANKIITQDALDKSLVAYEKMPKGSKK